VDHDSKGAPYMLDDRKCLPQAGDTQIPAQASVVAIKRFCSKVRY
jgi:hypothetical protein